MSRYDELVELGNAYNVAFAQAKLRSWNFAKELAEGLTAYLECPATTVFYVELDAGPAGGVRWGDRIWEVGAGKEFPFHKIKLIDDDFWCIGLEFAFGESHVRQRFGIKPSGDGFLVRLGTNKECKMHRSDEAGAKRFFDDWYAHIKESLLSKDPGAKARIGFHAGG